MFKKIKLLLLSALFSTSIYAIDLTHTNEILDTPTDATQAIEIEMDEVIENSTSLEEEIIPEPVMVMETEMEMIEGDRIPIEIIETEIPTLLVIEEMNNSVIETFVDESNTTFSAKENQPLEITPALLPTPPIKENNISVLEVNTTQLPEPINENQGDSTTGRNIFKYVLKADCGMTGYKFANKYTQEEWEEIAELHQFKETLFQTCPSVKTYYQERWTVDLYKFFYEIANDEEGIPEC